MKKIDQIEIQKREILSEGLRAARKRLGISPREAAETVGVSRRFYRDWENPSKPVVPGDKHWDRIQAMLGRDKIDLVLEGKECLLQKRNALNA